MDTSRSPAAEPAISEDLLQFVWKTRAVQGHPLVTVAGEEVEIVNPGVQNPDAGPDFSAARLRIGGVSWAGDVEVHIRSSLWRQHGHHRDAAYNRVVLHVVWEHDAEALRADGTVLPTLELRPYLPPGWLEKYHDMMHSMATIPCEAFLPGINNLHLVDAFGKALLARLIRKSRQVIDQVEALQGDWEQAAVRLLFEQFGFKKNNRPLRYLAGRIDYRVLRKLGSLQQTEAYLFGLAGLLPADPPPDSYARQLREEFAWLHAKFNLQGGPMEAEWWKFMRLRPANFPAQRLAQLAAFLHKRKRFFHDLLELPPAEAGGFFRVPVSPYWQGHYHFDKPAAAPLRGLGLQGARLLGINVAAVLLVAYGHYLRQEAYLDRALAFLEQLPAEQNNITRKWAALKVPLTSAAESQGAIELFNNYCKERKCLQCNVGSRILAPV